MTDQQEARRALLEELEGHADEIREWREDDDAGLSLAVDLVCYAESLLRDASAALSSPYVSGGWQGIETNPKDGAAFRAYAPELVHADFNPGGSVEACFDGERFVGAVWDGCFDAWNTVAITPTHWMPLPEAPKGPYHV